MKQLLMIALLGITAQASPVTIEAYLNDQQQGGSVSSVVCCEEEDDDRKWPWLFVGLAALPLAFIGGDEDQPPPITPPSQPTPTPTTSVPETGTVGLMSIGLLGLFVGFKGGKAVKRLALAAFMIGMIAGAATAKDGTLHVTLDPAMPVSIAPSDNVGATGISPATAVSAATEVSFTRPPGHYVVTVDLPDGNKWTKEVHLIGGRTCEVTVKYTPPTEKVVTKTVTKRIPIKEKEVVPCEEKPAVEAGVFDWCCECKRDELKAHLDLFAVELNTNPHATGYVSSQEAKDYLVNQRQMGPERITVRTSAKSGPCAVMWITTK